MSLHHTELINSSNQCIKNEIDIKEECQFREVSLPEWELVVLDPNVEPERCGDIFITNGDLILACVFCDNRFDTMLAFGEHIRSKHLQCEEEQNYKDYEEVRDMDPGKMDMIKSEHEEIFINCTDESRSSLFENSSMNSDSELDEIRLNNKTKSTADLDPFSASCNQQNENKKSLRQHHQLQENPKTRFNDYKADLYCEICNRHFKTKHNFRSHAIRHDAIPLAIRRDPNYLKCKYCDKQCMDHMEWYEHERTHVGDRRFTCPYCSKCFHRNSSRKLHISTHTGERPFQCDKCPRAFAHVTNLKRHIEAHLGVKRFACEICPKQFLLKTERDGHMRTHTGEKPFQCEECGRSFITCSKLTEHRKRHTGIKNFKCEICGSLFYSNISLKDHKVKHSDARPYQCTECGANFPRRKALKAHVKIHSDIKEYVCNICGREFAQAAGLYAHKKSHGGNTILSKAY